MSMAYALILSEMKTKFTAMGSNTGETTPCVQHLLISTTVEPL